MTFTIFSKGIKDGVARGGTYKTLTGEEATGISIYTELINDIPEFWNSSSLAPNISFAQVNRYVGNSS